MQIAFIMLLTGAFLAAVAYFLRMGLRQVRRTRLLARNAASLGLRFSAKDPFDIPARHADLAPVASGHSARAINVTYGHLGGWSVKAFDFYYELGHGTRRVSRHCVMALAETATPMPFALMWNDSDAEWAPLPARRIESRTSAWACRGNKALIELIASICRPFAADRLSIQSSERVLMLCAPGGANDDYSRLMNLVGCLLQALQEQRLVKPPGDARPASPPTKDVENSLSS